MTLAASGQMAIAGTVTDRSIQVELGGNGSTQMSMNDAAVRALGDQTVAGSAINMSTDFYGKSAGSGPPAQYLPVSLSGTDSATDTSIPAIITPVNNVQITGTTYWRRVRLTSSQAGSFRLYVRPRRNGTATSYRGDIQANMFIVTQSGTETELPFVSSGGAAATGWQRATKSSSSTTPSSWFTVSTNSASGGLFYIKLTSTPTASSGTGRLQNFIYTTRGFGYFETSGSQIPSSYYWLRSPAYTLAVGDTVDFYYGVDASSIGEVAFFLA